MGKKFSEMSKKEIRRQEVLNPTAIRNKKIAGTKFETSEGKIYKVMDGRINWSTWVEEK